MQSRSRVLKKVVSNAVDVSELPFFLAGNRDGLEGMWVLNEL